MFKVDCPIIAITGTNGKSSVTNCIAQLFAQNGKKIIINKEGNNLDTGICSLLLRHCTIGGKVEADYLIFETDESHVPVVYSQLKLETLVVLNFFRDQLDRNGEMETLIQKINGFCKTFEGNLILNGDDPNTARLGRANEKNSNVKYFHAQPYAFATKTIFEASEGRFCPFCGEPLEYEYYQYSHIGKFTCNKCGFGNYSPYITAENIDLEKVNSAMYKALPATITALTISLYGQRCVPVILCWAALKNLTVTAHSCKIEQEHRISLCSCLQFYR